VLQRKAECPLAAATGTPSSAMALGVIARCHEQDSDTLGPVSPAPLDGLARGAEFQIEADAAALLNEDISKTALVRARAA
jgi:hypothetical protein